MGICGCITNKKQVHEKNQGDRDNNSYLPESSNVNNYYSLPKNNLEVQTNKQKSIFLYTKNR